jgi:hypothetical protein
MLEEIAKFIEAYRGSWRHGATAIAEFYSEPCVMATMGVVRVNPTHRDTELLFVEAEAGYRARGFTHGDILNMDVHALGSDSALATVQWAYKGACEELLWKTTVSYNLYRRDGVWRILVQTTHDS